MTSLWNWSGCPPGRIQRMHLHGTSLSIIGMHHYRSSRPLRPRSSRQFMPLRSWDLLREPLAVAAHTACEHVRTLESSRVFICSGAGPACGENDTSQTRIGRGLCCKKQRVKGMRLRTGPALIPSSLIRVGSARRWGWLSLWYRQPDK